MPEFGLVIFVAFIVSMQTTDLLRRYKQKANSEVIADTERAVAESSGALLRKFDRNIEETIDDAVKRVASTSDEVIKQRLSERIDQIGSANLAQIVGDKVAAQSSEFAQSNAFKQEISDRFLAMRARALQYAESANRQSGFYRFMGFCLSIGGLITLAYAFLQNIQQFQSLPDLLDKHLEWPMIVVRHGSTYALVALSEILALIMFRYQSKALEYMRYFSNEATNIDARYIAIATALRFNDKAKISKLIEKFEATERNFLINKDQRTLEIANNENEDRLFERVRNLVSVTQSGGSANEGAIPKNAPRARKKP